MLPPIVDISRGKSTNHRADEFIAPSLEEFGVALEDEGVLVGNAVGESDVCDGADSVSGRGVHEVEGTGVVWFRKGVVI